MGRLAGIVIAAVAALALGACGGSTTTVVNNTTTVAEGTAATDVDAAVMMNFGSQEFTEPPEFSFSVNGDLVAEGLTWTNWGAASSNGEGNFAFRDYPSTRRVVVRGTVTVSNLSECKGVNYYTQATFDFAKAPPFEPQIPSLPTPCD